MFDVVLLQSGSSSEPSCIQRLNNPLLPHARLDKPVPRQRWSRQSTEWLLQQNVFIPKKHKIQLISHKTQISMKEISY